MPRVALTVITLFLAASLACAANVITYKAGPKMGPVTFNHKAHGDKLGCNACHPGTPARIDAFGKGKQAAHAVCYDCHKKNDRSQCVVCHK